ncbi:uncharacterized protein LOC143913663 [Arctopsyche grandis]|uniref:uncharacterized protein LOC143913663 n=1 Tax=Arctopsyche grandis TaxID=121162 RepID=UPI00406D7D2D
MFKFVLVLCFLVAVHGHGMVMDPVNRASRWRVDSSAPANYDDNQLWCGGAGALVSNGRKCGMCGDNFANPTPRMHELGGRYGQGVIVKSYRQGANIPITVRISANHRGYFQFRMCNLDRYGSESDACYDNILLLTSTGEDRHPIASHLGNHELVLRLPSGVTCKHCVLQWTYYAANTGENYRTCSDISIN